jgi:hypothetical protein
MKAVKFSLPIMLIIAMMSCFSVQAQKGGKGKKVKVVHSPGVTVVKVKPHVSRNAHAHYAHMPRWGSTVTVLPAGFLTFNSYYYHSGVYYTKRNNGFVVVRPARGLRITMLPAGYRRILVGPRVYYYHYGIFYTKVVNHNQYEIVDAPEGAVVHALPDGYVVKTVNDHEYYVLDGVYFGEVDAVEIDGGIGFKVMKM